MAGKTTVILHCRAHGGRFTKPEGRRGRNPVNCNPDEGWGCSGVETAIAPAKKRKPRNILNEEIPDDGTAELDPINQLMRPPTARKLPPGAQASKTARDTAEATLEGLGWTTALKGWVEGQATTEQNVRYHASITANRGAETLYLEWVDGKQVTSDYAIFDTAQPSANGGMPASDLPFDPEEVSDATLIEAISGNKITWWNRIGGMIESGICGDPKSQNGIRIVIEHVYNGLNGPMGVDRLIRFNLMDHGTRVIKVGALLKVG